MKPTRDQIVRLQNALLAAYDYNSLRQMVWLRLNEDLAQVTPVLGANLRDTTYDLIRYYAAQPGGFQKLTQAAHQDSPADRELAELAADFAEIEFDVLPVPKPGARLRNWVIGLSTLLFIFILAAAIVVYENVRIRPMGSGYNIAVARFGYLDDDGRCISSEEADEASEWLYSAISNEMQRLPDILKRDLRGPDAIGTICATDPQSRADQARTIANRHNAAVVIYGVISRQGGEATIQPEFYVSDHESFFYATELVGPTNLGAPILLEPSAGAGSSFRVNSQLDARRRALEYIVIGLGLFFADRYADAEKEFRSATQLMDWPDDAGKEIAYLLVGAAGMRQFDARTNPEPLAAAEQAYRTAYALNSEFARAHLGLGSVTLERSANRNAESGNIESVDVDRLIEARDWFSSSLTAKDQTAASNVAIKADYGLGQAYGLGAGYGVPDFTVDQATAHYQRVLQAVDAADLDYLRRFSAQAYAGLGQMDELRSDWADSAEHFARANAIWNDMPAGRDRKVVARNWASIGWAEGKQDNLCQALDAYQNAVEIGVDAEVSAAEQAEWEKIIQYLQTVGACESTASTE